MDKDKRFGLIVESGVTVVSMAAADSKLFTQRWRYTSKNATAAQQVDTQEWTRRYCALLPIWLYGDYDAGEE